MSTHPINPPSQHTLSTHSLNTPYQPTLSTHSLNTPYQPTLLTRPQSTLSGLDNTGVLRVYSGHPELQMQSRVIWSSSRRADGEDSEEVMVRLVDTPMLHIHASC